MSQNDKNPKIKTLSSSSKLKEENDSQSKTYLDSLYNSKLSQTEKENINKNNFISNIITEKVNENKNKNKNKYISKQKQRNFYMALKTLNTDIETNENNKNISNSFNSSNLSNNLLSLISEFPK